MELLRDRYKLGLALSFLFLLGIAVSVYSIYSLPHKLMLSSAAHTTLSGTYVILGITFIIGGLSIWNGLTYRKEVIVYRDRKLESEIAGREAANATQTTISLDALKESLRTARGTEDTLSRGLHAICTQLEAGQGAVYWKYEKDGRAKLQMKTGYAVTVTESNAATFEIGEGLIGQSAAGAKTLYVDEVPEGYIKILSGLGSASPRFLLIVPMMRENNVVGVMEIATFTALTLDQRQFVEEAAQLVVTKINN